MASVEVRGPEQGGGRNAEGNWKPEGIGPMGPSSPPGQSVT